MKKLLAIILSIALLVCACVLPVTAIDSDYDNNNKYIQRFNEKYPYIPSFEGDYAEYDELYYHYDVNGDNDWVFVKAKLPMSYDDPGLYHIGNLLLSNGYVNIPFCLGYAVYDVEEDKFYDIAQVWKNEKYKGVTSLFEDAFVNGDVDYSIGLVIGDLNNDKVITVYDATYLQRCLAGLEDYPVPRELYPFVYQKIAWDPDGRFVTFDINDFYDTNEDGTVSISDATRIQRTAAGFYD